MTSRQRTNVALKPAQQHQRKPKPPKIEVLVSTSAPGTVRDDARYRRLVESYLESDDEDWKVVEEIRVGFRNKAVPRRSQDTDRRTNAKTAKKLTQEHGQRPQRKHQGLWEEQIRRPQQEQKEKREEPVRTTDKSKDRTDRSWTYDLSEHSTFETPSSVIQDSQIQDAQQVTFMQTTGQCISSPEPLLRNPPPNRSAQPQNEATDKQPSPRQSSPLVRKREQFEKDLEGIEIVEDITYEYEDSSHSVISSSVPEERTVEPSFFRRPSQAGQWDKSVPIFETTQFYLGSPKGQCTQLADTHLEKPKPKKKKPSPEPPAPDPQPTPSVNIKKRKTKPPQSTVAKSQPAEDPVFKVPATPPSQKTAPPPCAPRLKPKALAEPSLRKNQLSSPKELEEPPFGYKRFTASSFAPPTPQNLTKIPPKTNSQRTPTPSPISPDRRSSIPEFRSKPRSLAELFPQRPILEIHSSEPDINSNPGQVPPKLKSLVGNKLLCKFQPVSQLREPMKWERGYWRINTVSWDENTKKAFWTDLTKVVTKGSAGLVEVFPESKKTIKSEDGERWGDVLRLYCFGGVYKLLWTMLMILSNGETVKAVKWVDGKGDIVVDCG